MSEEFSNVDPIPDNPRRVIAYASPTEEKPEPSDIHSLCALVAGLFAGMFVVYECCEHTETFFAKGHSSEIDAFACLIEALPFAFVVYLLMRLFFRRRGAWAISLVIGIAAPIAVMFATRNGKW